MPSLYILPTKLLGNVDMTERIEMQKSSLPSYEEIDDYFFHLTQRSEGLADVENVEILTQFAESRNNLDDVIYTFKFIPEKQVFADIILSEGERFERLSNEERQQIVKLSESFYHILNNPAIIYEVSEMDHGDSGTFIAYPYIKRDSNERERDKLYLSWKRSDYKVHIFEEMLKMSKLEMEDFPNKLRTVGLMEVNTDENNVYINFGGNSDMRSNLFIYSPALLRNFDWEIKRAFQIKGKHIGKMIHISY